MITKDSIIQVSPNWDNKRFAGCLAIVAEVKAWGCICYVDIPGNVRAFLRVPSEFACYTGGIAPWIKGYCPSNGM